MLQSRFYASLGVLDVPDEDTKVTYYLSRAFNAYYFSTFNVVPWTNCICMVDTQLKNAIQDQGLPECADTMDQWGCKVCAPSVRWWNMGFATAL